MIKQTLFCVLTISCIGIRTATAGAECSPPVAEGILWRRSNTVQVRNIFGYQEKPKVGGFVHILPIKPKAPSFQLTVERVESTLLPDVEVTLSDLPVDSVGIFAPPNPRTPNYLGDVVIIGPINNEKPIPRLVSIEVQNLPPNTSRNVVKAAISLSSTTKPDILIIEFLCKNRGISPKANDEYVCTEFWQKTNEQWQRCNSLKPL